MSALPYDLTPTILKYLDRHIAVQLLNAISEMQPCPYSEDAITKAQYQLCSGTKLYGDLSDAIESLYEDGKQKEEMLLDLQHKQAALVENHNKTLKEGGVVIFNEKISTPEGAELIKKMTKEQTLALEGMPTFGLTAQHLKDIKAFARTVFEYGQYQDSARMLRFLRQIDSATYKHDTARIWGQLACSILICLREDEGHSWKETIDDLAALNESIDITSTGLNSVLFFLHWSLFVFLASNAPNGRDQLLDVFMSDKYFPTINASAPHLLRYICVSMLTVRGQRRGGRMGPALKALRDYLDNDSLKYTDPITTIVHTLFVKCDAKAALAMLPEVEAVMSTDYFLVNFRADFVESIRRNAFEDICRVHSTVDLATVAAAMCISIPEAEKWIVNVVRPARINARLDGSTNTLHVQADNTIPSASHLVMEKTKLLSFRVQSLYKTCIDARNSNAHQPAVTQPEAVVA